MNNHKPRLVEDSGWPDHASSGEPSEVQAVLADMPEIDRRIETHGISFSGHSDLEECQKDLQHTKRLLEIQTRHATALQRKVSSLEAQLEAKYGDLRKENRMLSKQLLDLQAQESLSIEAQLAEAKWQFDNCGPRAELLKERDGLLVELGYQREEVQRWKAEAHCQSAQLVNRSLQANVDEKVRLAREQDAYLLKNLNDQIAALEAREDEEMVKRKEAEHWLELMRSRDSDAVVDDSTWLGQCMMDQIGILEDEKAAEIAKREEAEHELEALRRSAALSAAQSQSYLVTSLQGEIDLLRAASGRNS